MSFFIEQLIVSGSGKTDSIIEFEKGVNIIYGPSNTGKTYIVKCIDFLFGSKKVPIDVSTGYEYIKLIVKTESGRITMIRKIDENKIDISSTDPHIASGKYSTKASKLNHNKTINAVWLSLIGIEDLHYIIVNENYKKQILSWRSFSHLFLITETKIISEYSSILSGHDTSNTATLSSLIFLLSGQDFAEANVKDSKEIKTVKRNAVKSYINKELFTFSERHRELLSEIDELGNADISKEIVDIMSQIENDEHCINKAISENKEVLSGLHEKNESLSECKMLLNRYCELSSQYEADLKRLSFIVDGEANDNEKISSQCPFCDGAISISETPNYIDAAKSDYRKIKLQAKDLLNASESIRLEKKSLEQMIEILMLKKKATEELIEKELKPKISLLKEKLNIYKETIELQNEISILKKIATQKSVDMLENEVEDEDESKYKVKEHLDYNFISTLEKNIRGLLENCKYDNLMSVIFDKSNMDIIINGKKKGSNGKGYNAFLNSVVAIALSRYMCSKAKYYPGFLVLDSPILSLKETETKKLSESMRNVLFENIVNNQKGMQTIIVENEIPNIDYENAHLIHFSKEKDQGRYGFLFDVTD